MLSMLWNFLSFLDAIFIGYFILSGIVFDFILILFYIYILLLISDFLLILILNFELLSILFYLFTFVFIVMQNVMEDFRILDTCLGKLQKVLEHVTCHVMSSAQPSTACES